MGSEHFFDNDDKLERPQQSDSGLNKVVAASDYWLHGCHHDVLMVQWAAVRGGRRERSEARRGAAGSATVRPATRQGLLYCRIYQNVRSG